MASIVDPDSDIKTDSPPGRKVRHGYCSCQSDWPIQTALCGHAEPGRPLHSAPKTPPADACVVCMDLAYAPRTCCGLGIF